MHTKTGQIHREREVGVNLLNKPLKNDTYYNEREREVPEKVAESRSGMQPAVNAG